MKDERLERVRRQLKLYEHPLVEFVADAKGDSVEVSIRPRFTEPRVHVYSFELHPRDLDDAQLEWTLQRQIFDASTITWSRCSSARRNIARRTSDGARGQAVSSPAGDAERFGAFAAADRRRDSPLRADSVLPLHGVVPLRARAGLLLCRSRAHLARLATSIPPATCMPFLAGCWRGSSTRCGGRWARLPALIWWS